MVLAKVIRTNIPVSEIAQFTHRIITDGISSCWEWHGAHSTTGYSSTRFDGQVIYVHRFLYQQIFGAIENHLHLDHLCRNRGCVNPSHLELVTAQINALRGYGSGGINARKTHCVRGHEFNEANTILRNRRKKDGIGKYRLCIPCNRIAQKKYYYKLKENNYVKNTSSK